MVSHCHLVVLVFGLVFQLIEQFLSEDEKEGITVDGKTELEDKVFHRTLVEKLWTNNPINTRAFQSTIPQAWHLKNNAQELGKNMFLFRLSSKRDIETFLKSEP